MYIEEANTQIEHEVKPSDSIAYALHKMSDLHSSQLAVVDNQSFIGLISEDQLLNQSDVDQEVGQLNSLLKFVYLFNDQHPLDALQYMSAHQLSVLPILDKEHKYTGSITAKELLHELNDILGNSEPGAIIVLELGKADVSLSHITHLIESENVHIRSLAIREIPDSTKVEMTIKVDKQNIAPLVASLWRFDYTVKATFNDGSPDSDINDRYGILMNYLNL